MQLGQAQRKSEVMDKHDFNKNECDWNNQKYARYSWNKYGQVKHDYIQAELRRQADEQGETK